MDIRDHIHELTDSTKEKTMRNKPMKRDGGQSGPPPVPTPTPSPTPSPTPKPINS